jgi:hypothetical protein
MRKNLFTSILTFSAVVSTLCLSSCEKVIDFKVADSPAELVVDAFLTSDTVTQKIILTYTQNILDSSNVPPVLGAIVKVKNSLVIPGVIDTNRTFTFSDPDNDGVYTYDHPKSDLVPFGFPFSTYELSVVVKGEEFVSTTFMDETVDIKGFLGDTLLKEVILPNNDTIQEGYVLTLSPQVKDIAGRPNGYWFKTFKNGKEFNRTNDLNLAYDAAFGPGFDGNPFIVPIVSGLTPSRERFKKDDEVRVECHSVGVPTIYFLNQAVGEINNTGLFARPPGNVPSNIEPKNKDSKTKVHGWFSAAAVSKQTITIK